MKNLIVRTLSAIVIVWLMLEAIASESYWFYVLWAVIGLGSIIELVWLTVKHPTRGGWMWAVGGTLYISIAMGLASAMYSDWVMAVVMLTLVWANDVGAYLIGVAIGRHKMAPKISPKKSWEGFAGGLVAAVAVALIWWGLYFEPREVFVDQSGVNAKLLWALLGLFVALAAVGGDLIESKFKRVVGVKDSSKIIPGHGGMLDRFDALFMAVPAMYLAMAIFKLLG